jgi:hypothetical protein
MAGLVPSAGGDVGSKAGGVTLFWSLPLSWLVLPGGGVTDNAGGCVTGGGVVLGSLEVSKPGRPPAPGG